MVDLRNRSPENHANQVLAQLGITDIPVPVDKIAKWLGARLRFSPLDEELSGFIFVRNGVPIIGINSLHHPNRQRFSISHEIAHLRLHPTYISSAVHVDTHFAEPVLKRDQSSATGTKRLEVEANQFAAALLMPRHVLSQLLKNSPIDIEDEASLEELATQFFVSKAALQYRIRNL